MPMPKYEPDCALDCRDRNGNPRVGSEWIHLDGRTLYVCATCANRTFGVAQRRREVRASERRAQEEFDG